MQLRLWLQYFPQTNTIKISNSANNKPQLSQETNPKLKEIKVENSPIQPKNLLKKFLELLHDSTEFFFELSAEENEEIWFKGKRKERKKRTKENAKKISYFLSFFHLI